MCFDSGTTINNRKTDVSEALDKLKNESYKPTLVGGRVTRARQRIIPQNYL